MFRKENGHGRMPSWAALFGASPRLGECQSCLQGLLLGCFRMLSISVEENGDAMPFGTPKGTPSGLGKRQRSLENVLFRYLRFFKHLCGTEWGSYCSLQWGCRCCAYSNGRDTGPSDAPKGALFGLGDRQCSLVFFLLLCFSLLSICAKGNWGCPVVCNGLSVFCILRWVGCKARRHVKRRV